MREGWDRRIRRADELAAADSAARPLIAFYAMLLGLQKALYESLRRRAVPMAAPATASPTTGATEATGAPTATGALDRDLPIIRPHVRPLLLGVAAHGPESLARQARALATEGESAIDELLLTYWRAPSDTQFFAKAILQPYAEWLAEEGVSPSGRQPERGANRCPFCGGRPQLSVLRVTSDPLAHGSARTLVCATCFTAWPFRRVLCAACGEDDERMLEFFQLPAGNHPGDHLRDHLRDHLQDHLQIDACGSCRRYLKSVDLTRLGVAVPIVDEVAGATLDAWARERGYEKIELNLVGL